MIIYPKKKQQGGTIGKAGRMHIQPVDRSAILNYNPQIREIRTAGPSTSATSAKSAAREKSYQNMLPSDRAFIQGLKDNKMQEIQDKYANVKGYEGSQENLSDLEEYRDYDANLSVNGKHYATQFTKNAKLANSRKAEGSMAALGGEVLAQRADGSYDILSYDELVTQNPDGTMKAKPLSIGDAILLRQSDPSFNSFGGLGQFVDNLLMNTYNPDDLTKSMKTVASQAKMNKFMIDEKGQQVDIADVIKDISAKGGIAATLKSNKDKVYSLSNYFKTIMNPNAANFLHNKAVSDIYEQVAAGQLQLEEGQSIRDAIAEHEAATIANYFYGAVGEELGLTKTGSGSGGGGAQKKWDTTPLSSALYQSGAQRELIEVPGADGKVSQQSYNAAPITLGPAIFNSDESYILPKDSDGVEGRTITNNTMLKTIGDKNKKFMAMADGTVLDDAVGLGNVALHPDASYYMLMAPVRKDERGGWVPAFDLISMYGTLIDTLREAYAAGKIRNEKDVEPYLQGMPENVTIKPMLVADVLVKNDKTIDDRLVRQEQDDNIRNMFEEMIDDEMWDKKVKVTKAFMVVDNPDAYANLTVYGDKVGKYDITSSEMLTSGRVGSTQKTSDINTFNSVPMEKDGGKAPSADEIREILYGKK